MASIHFILQGKGGVGKTVIAVLWYQVLSSYNFLVYAFDTDPVNATLSGYKEFQVTRLNLLNEEGNINNRNFDFLLEQLAIAPENSHVIVDNGASSFISLGSYMKDVDMLETLKELGHQIFFHTVITGGQAIEDTINGFISLADNFPSSNLVVWLNPFFGAIELEGKTFSQFQCYKDYQNHIHSLIELPFGNKELIGKDLEQVFMKKESLKVAMENSKHIAVRSRLNKYWKQLLKSVEEANLC